MSRRAAVITDLHGNMPALEAALGGIEQLGVDAIHCGGDLVGYGPRPNEICALIEERRIPTIYGNYDGSPRKVNEFASVLACCGSVIVCCSWRRRTISNR